MATPMMMRLVRSTLSLSSAVPPRAKSGSAADGAAVVGARLGPAEGTAVGAVLPGAAVGSTVGE